MMPNASASAHLLIIKDNECYKREGVLNLIIIKNNEYEFNKYCYISIDNSITANEVVFSCLLDDNKSLKITILKMLYQIQFFENQEIEREKEIKRKKD